MNTNDANDANDANIESEQASRSPLLDEGRLLLVGEMRKRNPSETFLCSLPRNVKTVELTEYVALNKPNLPMVLVDSMAGWAIQFANYAHRDSHNVQADRSMLDQDLRGRFLTQDALSELISLQDEMDKKRVTR